MSQTVEMELRETKATQDHKALKEYKVNVV